MMISTVAERKLESRGGPLVGGCGYPPAKIALWSVLKKPSTSWGVKTAKTNIRKMLMRRKHLE